MARRAITPLVDLCDEIGLPHLQATELFRRIGRELQENRDVIVQEFGTFYLRQSAQRDRVLNGVRYTVPARRTNALRGVRFPQELIAQGELDVRIVSNNGGEFDLESIVVPIDWSGEEVLVTAQLSQSGIGVRIIILSIDSETGEINFNTQVFSETDATVSRLVGSTVEQIPLPYFQSDFLLPRPDGREGFFADIEEGRQVGGAWTISVLGETLTGFYTGRFRITLGVASDQNSS